MIEDQIRAHMWPRSRDLYSATSINEDNDASPCNILTTKRIVSSTRFVPTSVSKLEQFHPFVHDDVDSSQVPLSRGHSAPDLKLRGLLTVCIPRGVPALHAVVIVSDMCGEREMIIDLSLWACQITGLGAYVRNAPRFFVETSAATSANLRAYTHAIK